MITDVPLLPFNRWPLPQIRVEVVVLTIKEGVLHALMRRERDGPCAGCWALIGGFVREERSFVDLARTILAQATGLRDVDLSHLQMFDTLGRDPRGWVVSATFLALAPLAHVEAAIAGQSGLALVEARYDRSVKLSTMAIGDFRPRLAMDHEEIVVSAIEHLRAGLEFSPRCLGLLPETFTLLDLQRVHEAILEHGLNQMPFRKRMQGRVFGDGSCLQPTEAQVTAGGRPARLYRLSRPSL